MRTWTRVAGVIAAMMAAPSAAFAQTPPVGGGDEVTLKNGGLVRGNIVSMDPGKEVVIVIQGLGETRRVPWADVDHVNRGDGAPAAPPPGPTFAHVTFPGLAPLPPPQSPELGAPRIHIVADQPISLHRSTLGLGGRLLPVVCTAPCDAVVDGRAGQAFYFAGDEIPDSSRFLLSEKSGDVSVRVHGGNAAVESTGSVFLALGILGSAMGAVVLPIGLAVNASIKSESMAGPSQLADTHTSPLPLVGGVMLGASATVLMAGILMNVLGKTRYEFKSARGTTAAVVEPGVIRF